MRFRIVNRFRFITFVVVSILLVSLILSGILNLAFSSEREKDMLVCERVTIKDGDTLWDIAKNYGPNTKDIRFTVYEICKLNNISAGDIKSGDVILVPCN